MKQKPLFMLSLLSVGLSYIVGIVMGGLLSWLIVSLSDAYETAPTLFVFAGIVVAWAISSFALYEGASKWFLHESISSNTALLSMLVVHGIAGASALAAVSSDSASYSHWVAFPVAAVAGALALRELASREG